MYMIVNIVVAMLMLAIASIMDVRRREVSDLVWIIAIIAGMPALILHYMEYGGSLQMNLARHVVGVSISSLLAYMAYRYAMFGGADAKAVAAISIILPHYEMGYSIHGIPALTVLTNASILTIANVVHNIARNTAAIARGIDIFKGFEGEPWFRKVTAFMIGFVARKPRGYLFAIEDVKDGRRVFAIGPNACSDYVTEDARDIWVTPALPFILYITIGFVLMIYIGDLLAYLLHIIL